VDDYRRRKRFRTQRLNRQGFYERRQQRSRARRAALRDGLGNLLSLRQIANHENLIAAYYRLKAESGASPGPDRVTYKELGHREVAAVMRDLAKELIDGTYEPSTARQVKIRKSSGKGYRTLSLRSILHRVVAKVLADALGPYFDQMFLPGSHGFRSNRGPWSMLVEMERIILDQERYVIAQDDIANAFDNVPVDHVMDLYRRYVEDPELLVHVNKILRGHQAERRTIGIDQGSALSPLCLNVVLHHALDKPFSGNAANPPWLRYADNLVYLCQGVNEGQAAIQAAQQLLKPIGMTLKGVDGQPVDIRHQGTEILGFAIRWEDGQIRYDLTKGALCEL
jgi:RNA-directed DNA polymerase